MARLPALVDALATLDGRPRGAVDHIARALREAGLIQTTKRGRGAAEMTALDAAALVLGLYGLPDASPEAIAQAHALAGLKRGKPTRMGLPTGEHDPLPAELRPLASAPTLLDAVAAVIELGPILRSDRSRQDGFDGVVLLHRPQLAGAVSVRWKGVGGPAGQGQGLSVAFRSRGPGVSPYAVSTEVRTPVFITLHRALFPKTGPG